ncbi:hypothetical protein Pfo_014942 [Paulownia fortunei]|nr:hypothetical protein Pfo_014942 [Paulownia fortunei]
MENYICKSIATILIVLTLLYSSIDSGCAARPAAGDTNTKFIRTSCSTTTYPTLCYSSLSSHASAIQQDPKLLAHAALSVSLDTARSTSVDMVKLSRGAGMTPREVGAMRDCVEELSDSVDELRKSMAEMNQIKGSNFELMMSDIQTWVSAALTDEDTCMDGFAGKVMNGAAKTAVRARIVNVAHMTSNALALINSYAVLHGVDGTGFIARGITFRNTAGPESGQAVALRSASDLSVFYACSFEGYQDTIFVHAQRQFFKSCYIYGTVDIIFGNAAVVFQNCIIYVRKPLVGQANMITAQGRGDPFQNTGISIHNCRVMAAPDLKPVVGSFKTYLGRPWQQYSRTVVIKTYLDDLVAPEGWSTWDNTDFALSTLYYGEYQNFGPAASTENRVKWPGYHVITSPNEASRFTVASLIAGRAWLPATGVPFIAGL